MAGITLRITLLLVSAIACVGLVACGESDSQPPPTVRLTPVPTQAGPTRTAIEIDALVRAQRENHCQGDYRLTIKWDEASGWWAVPCYSVTPQGESETGTICLLVDDRTLALANGPCPEELLPEVARCDSNRDSDGRCPED